MLFRSEVLTAHSFALDVLDQYDHQCLQLTPSDRKSKFRITYENAVAVIEQLRKTLRAGDFFGREKDKSLQGSLATLYQTFDGQELYPSVEEKAAQPALFCNQEPFLCGWQQVHRRFFYSSGFWTVTKCCTINTVGTSSMTPRWWP